MKRIYHARCDRRNDVSPVGGVVLAGTPEGRKLIEVVTGNGLQLITEQSGLMVIRVNWEALFRDPKGSIVKRCGLGGGASITRYSGIPDGECCDKLHFEGEARGLQKATEFIRSEYGVTLVFEIGSWKRYQDAIYAEDYECEYIKRDALRALIKCAPYNSYFLCDDPESWRSEFDFECFASRLGTSNEEKVDSFRFCEAIDEDLITNCGQLANRLITYCADKVREQRLIERDDKILEILFTVIAIIATFILFFRLFAA